MFVQAKAEHKRAQGTLLTGVLLELVENEGNQTKRRKGCLKATKAASADGVVLRPAVLEKAQAAIRMELQ